MTATDNRSDIQTCLSGFKARPLADASLELFETLGYSTERQLRIEPNSASGFMSEFGDLNATRALTADWKTADFLFQLTEEEIGTHLRFSSAQVDNTRIESYVFLAIGLAGERYTRTQLATIVREVNGLFRQPAMILFRHGATLSLGVIDRELNKRDPEKDVRRKVTLIKDINITEPSRAHVEILHDLSLPTLHEEFRFHNFVELHRAWAKRLDNTELNKRFYRDIADWYLWAQKHAGVRLPKNVDEKSEEERSIFFIRLLTRLIFCWFLQEKGLIPRSVFRWNDVKTTLKDTKPEAGTYYQAVLQNLFFATLNQEPEKRGFRGKKSNKSWYDGNYGIPNLYRYESLLKDPAGFRDLLSGVPFVNGGLFDCLDEVHKKGDERPSTRFDGFSDNARHGITLPNELFFGAEQHADLSNEYRDQRRSNVTVRPLLATLDRYRFTVEESTPLEQEIALDPELLGNVFENLLASYNDETRTVARKKLGAFYTPRNVVRYMVDEALIAHLGGFVPGKKVRQILAGNGENPCTKAETKGLIAAIDKIRILDPACGSGAFLMGGLQRLVHLLAALDPDNAEWKKRQLEAAKKSAKSSEVRQENGEDQIQEIERSFDTEHHDLDYARKLYLIENSIFGVDIQPIACQIAKLRFFISLLVDQKAGKRIRPLPNLETRLVAANTLIPAEALRRHQYFIGADQVKGLRDQLKDVRHKHFNARTTTTKRRYRDIDEEIRKELAEELKRQGTPNTTARLLAEWDPYDQNAHAEFFDPAWMFSLDGDEFEGFDVVIGNPPYVRQERFKDDKPAYKSHYDCYTGTADLYVYFYERGMELLKERGVFSFITSNKWLRSGYGKKLREFLKAKTGVFQLIDFGDADVFDAIAYPCIILFEKGKPPENATLHALNWEDDWRVEELEKHVAADMFPMMQADLGQDAWRLESRTKLDLLERIRAAGTPLGEYVNGRFYYGIKTGLNKAFVVDRETRDRLIAEHPSSEEVLKPFLRGRDVKRWRVEPQDLWLIFTRRGIDIKKYPAIKKHLTRFRNQLEPKPPDWNTDTDGTWAGRKAGSYKWYEIQDNIAYWEEFEQPKIIYPDIYEHQSFAWDDDGFYGANTCYFIPIGEKWLAAVLNSQCIEWFYSQLSNKVRGGYLRAFSDYMKNVPIPAATPSRKEVTERIVEGIMHLGGQGPEAAALERLLNGLVYEVFFPEDLHAQKIQLFDLLSSMRIPARWSDSAISAFHREISNNSHPIYAALFKLNGLEVVRIIEERE